MCVLNKESVLDSGDNTFDTQWTGILIRWDSIVNNLVYADDLLQCKTK
jgi:hypothetical protein